MPDIPPLYEVRLLTFHIEAFATTAVSNAIWLAGEWLAQKPDLGETFAPELKYIFAPRCWEEALLAIDNLPEPLRYEVLAASFMWHGNDGEDQFRRAVSDYPEMLREALEAEWVRRWEAAKHLIDRRRHVVNVANELLPRLAIHR